MNPLSELPQDKAALFEFYESINILTTSTTAEVGKYFGCNYNT